MNVAIHLGNAGINLLWHKLVPRFNRPSSNSLVTMMSYTLELSPSRVESLQAFKRRDCLPLHKTSLWHIQSGTVRTLTFTEDGAIIPLGFWGAQDVVGSLISQIQPYQIECLTDVKAIAIAPDHCQSLNHVLLAHIQQMEKLLRIRNGQVQQRLLQLLEWLAERFGHESDRGRQIEIRLTHQDMADVIGTTRVTITRLMGLFEREGLVDCSGQYCVLLKH
jgi:CRP-like cAMP-binding protein